jgi:hypothetical protein
METDNNNPPLQATSFKPEYVVKIEPNYSVDVSIEPNHECEIVEMKFDGQEIYKELVLF